jgi:hypothetical protein
MADKFLSQILTSCLSISCGMWEKREMCTGFWWGILKKSNGLEELGRWIIFK